MATRILYSSATRLRASSPSHRIAHYYKKVKKKQGLSGRTWATVAGVSTTLFGAGVYSLGQPEEHVEGLDQDGDKYANENVIKAHILRAWERATDFRKVFSEPSSQKLLPDMLSPQYQRPYTLILELNDVLVHTEYNRSSGWKFQKRPGLDKFLMQLIDFYEIIIFTTGNAISCAPVIEALDPEHYTMYHLYRDSTKYINGHHVKDLTHLNRPLTKVIVVDVDAKAVDFQRENSIIVNKWAGDITDTTLMDLVPFLLTIAANDVDDIRPVLDFYKSQGEGHILETFRANQARLRAEEEREQEERERLMSQRATGGYRLGGSIPMFKLGSPLRKKASVGTEPGAPDTPVAPEEHGSAEEATLWSVTGWIGSWLGWK